MLNAGAKASGLVLAIDSARNEVLLAIRSTTRAADQLTEAVSVTETSAEAVSTIEAMLQLIRNVAGRTKLLSLNATIEASRAGDAGRGFAIVAQEIKSLAIQSGTSVDDISQKIVAVQVAIAATIDANRAIRDTVADVRSFVARASDTISQQADTTATIISAVDDTGSAAEAIESTITDMRSNADAVTREIGALREAFDLLSRRLIELQAAAQAYVQAS